LRYLFLTPHVCQDNIIAFDQAQPVKPFVLKMRPAIVAKSGKKQTHTPTNGELRGTGLTVNKVQLHISESERSPLDGKSLSRSLDKWGRPASAKIDTREQSKHRCSPSLPTLCATPWRCRTAKHRGAHLRTASVT
jgi:hypothetical protein